MKKKRVTGNRKTKRIGITNWRDLLEEEFDESEFEEEDFVEEDFEEDELEDSEEDVFLQSSDEIWDEDDEPDEELILPPLGNKAFEEPETVEDTTTAGERSGAVAAATMLHSQSREEIKKRDDEARETRHAAYAKKQKRKFGLIEIGMLVGGVAIAAVLVFLLVNLFGGRRSGGQQTAQSGFSADALIAVESIGNDGIASVTNRAERELAEQMAQGQDGTDQDLTDVTAPEEDEKQEIYATLNLTSIEKDLKVKFMNATTQKLLAGVAFVVNLESKEGQKYTFTDDNKDGIIHKTDLKPGTYKVTVQEVDGYLFDKQSYSVVIKDQIEYAKVDVTGEVKTEDEVDSSKEDTAQKEEQEVVLENTVEWVETTKTLVNGGVSYQEIDKSKIVNPETLVSVGGVVSGNGYMLMTELTDNYVTSVTVSANSGTTNLSLNDTVTLVATVSGVGSNYPTAVTWTSSDPTHATVTDGTVTMISEVTVDTSVTITATATGYAQDGENHLSGTFVITLKARTADPVYVSEVTVNPASTTLAVGGEATLTATLKYSDNSTADGVSTGKIQFTSSDETIATVSAQGVVKAKKAGEVTITATSLEQNEQGSKPTAACVIRVGNASVSVSIEEKKQIYLNVPVTIPVTLVLNGTTTQIDGSAATQGLVSWTSSDTDIARVDPVTGLIQPVKKGTFTLTATSVDKNAEGKTVSASCTVTVLTDPKTDTTTLLKDESGNQIYIYKNNAYVEAVSADYYTATKFYIRGGEPQYKYTGWQVFDGYTYFFDKSGNMVTGVQVINGVKYTFREDGRLDTGNGVLGIDVSRYNGTIDWNKVKESGVNFVIIRCGYRGSTQGALVEDLNFKTNIKGATAAGLKVGVYFFSQAITEAEAVEEASMVLSLVKDYKLAYPIFIDTEPSGGRGDTMNAEQRTKVCKAFCQTIQNSGYSAGIYASKYYFNNHLIASQLSAYKIWVAQYNTTCTYAGKYDMWQFSSTGNISGIKGNVDLNYSYGL